MSRRLRWGIVSTGNIARKCVVGMRDSDTGVATAVASRDLDKARRFAAELGIERAYRSYAELYADPDIDVVYIATPHPYHLGEVLAACAAGKHVLCEKPAGMHRGEVDRMLEAAAAADVFWLEAFRYRFHPQTLRVQEWLGGGEIGELRAVDASYGFHGSDDPAHRLRNKALGGGGILDVGCYPVSMARLLMGVADGRHFADPVDVVGFGHLGDTGVDDWASALLRFDGDRIARVHTAVQLDLDNALTLYGSKGRIHVSWPWNPERGGEAAWLELHRAGCEVLREQRVCVRDLFAYEIDEVATGLDGRQSARMSWDDSRGNATTLDRWRDTIGLRYPADADRLEDARA